MVQRFYGLNTTIYSYVNIECKIALASLKKFRYSQKTLKINLHFE